MRWRWLLGNFADPQHDLTRRQQHEISNHAHEHHMPGRRFVAWTLLAIVLPALLLYAVVLPLVLSHLGLADRTGPFVIGAIAVSLVVWVLSAFVYGWIYVRAVRRAMRDFGHDICVGCGYRLDGLPPDAALCPECGAQRPPPITARDRPAAD